MADFSWSNLYDTLSNYVTGDSAAASQTPGVWDGFINQLSGQTGSAEQDIQKWRRDMSAASFFGTLAASLLGNTPWGNTGKALASLGQGGLVSKNAELETENKNKYMNAIMSALAQPQQPAVQAGQAPTAYTDKVLKYLDGLNNVNIRY